MDFNASSKELKPMDLKLNKKIFFFAYSLSNSLFDRRPVSDKLNISSISFWISTGIVCTLFCTLFGMNSETYKKVFILNNSVIKAELYVKRTEAILIVLSLNAIQDRSISW